MQIKNLENTINYLRAHMLNSTETAENVNRSEEVNPVMIRKTPKFPSRDRHLAIRRRRPPSSPESQKSESLSLSFDSEESTEIE